MSARIAIVSLVVILGLVNWAILGKEKHLAGGRIVYLELAPVDPRSLMQGDYMALNYRVANAVYLALLEKRAEQDLHHDLAAADGYVVVKRDERGIGTFEALYDKQDLGENEMLLRYRVRGGAVKFATNAFFFQEGHGKYYQPARYGQFRVDAGGELLLTGIYDEALNRLGPEGAE